SERVRRACRRRRADAGRAEEDLVRFLHCERDQLAEIVDAERRIATRIFGTEATRMIGAKPFCTS
ncbi:MAG: hypothetical protein WBD95_28100, partial [Xanthobacteraceae bacterium]